MIGTYSIDPDSHTISFKGEKNNDLEFVLEVTLGELIKIARENFGIVSFDEITVFPDVDEKGPSLSMCF